jgi:hypothetical protein
VAPVARLVERIMQRAHKHGSFNIRRILVAENPPLLADDEAKILNVVRQVLETKAQRPVRRDIEIEKLEILKVGQKNVARKLVLLEARKIIERLFSRGGQAASGGRRPACGILTVPWPSTPLSPTRFLLGKRVVAHFF